MSVDPHHDDDDGDLRRAFAALRLKDAQRTPRLDALLDAAYVERRPRTLVPLLGALAMVVAAATVLVVMDGRGPAPPPEPGGSIERWVAPTDFLLRTPGSEILETTPRIGRMRSASP